MEKRSRVHKYQSLREQLAKEITGSTTDPEIFENPNDSLPLEEEDDYIALVEKANQAPKEEVHQEAIEHNLDNTMQINLSDTLSFDALDLEDFDEEDTDNNEIDVLEAPEPKQTIPMDYDDPFDSDYDEDNLGWKEQKAPTAYTSSISDTGYVTMSDHSAMEPIHEEGPKEKKHGSDFQLLEEPHPAEFELAPIAHEPEPMVVPEPELVVEKETEIQVEDVKVEEEPFEFEEEEIPTVEEKEEPLDEEEEDIELGNSVYEAPKEIESIPENYTEQDFDIETLDDDEDFVFNIGDNFLDQTIDEAKRYSISKGERSAIDTTSAIIAELTQEPVEEEEEDTSSYATHTDIPKVDDLMRPVDANHLGNSDFEYNSEIDALLNGPEDDVDEGWTMELKEDFPIAVDMETPEINVDMPSVPEAEEEFDFGHDFDEDDDLKITSISELKNEDALHDNDLGNMDFLTDDDLDLDLGAYDEEEPSMISMNQSNDIDVSSPTPEPQLEPVHEDQNIVAPTVNHVVDEDAQQKILELTTQLETEHVLRADLEETTKKMKIDLEQMGDEVNEVTTQVNKQGAILNFILIVLIVALFIILGFIAYWTLVDKGILQSDDFQRLFSVVFNPYRRTL